MNETGVNAHHNIKHILILHQSGPLDTVSTVFQPNLIGFLSDKRLSAH